ncbi:MAG: anthranilate synthase component I family protein [Simkaniaceae bacterium]|nr:MAG: anthranilate synthase component I family protein [Simkaniaceae bacterium]
MFEKLSYDEFHELSLAHDRVAVYQEFSADLLTPMGALHALQKEHQEVILLESGIVQTHMGRYSHIGFDPIAEVSAYGFEIQVKTSDEQQVHDGDPFKILRKLRLKYECGSHKRLLGFCGGAAGYLSYDAIRYIEDIPDKNKKTQEFPDLFFQFFDQGITFDHEKNTVLIVRIMEVKGNAEKAYKEGLHEIEQIYKLISTTSNFMKVEPKNFDLTKNVKVTPDDESFRKIIAKAKEYIDAGDVFQVVPSRRFEVDCTISPFELYRSLRHVSPSPYMFYISHGKFSILGASPEKLVSVHGRNLETIPLAGTRPRGKTPEEDLSLANELQNDPKETAEHMMLVDLGRNDLGAVSKPGTVKVEKLKTVQNFSHVMHLASFITGELREELDAFDALKATFPAGTLSGAPKIRAMEIIDELEDTRRGPYGGAICFIDHEGNLESCIGIRMATIKEGKAVCQTGMGIVIDSDPEMELAESRYKARGVLSSIQAALEGTV